MTRTTWIRTAFFSACQLFCLLALADEPLPANLAGKRQVESEFELKRATNWHQWRGPDATGVAPEANPPIEWNEHRHVKWKAEIVGLGKSSPIVWDNKVFLTTAINTGKIVEEAAKPESQPERPFGIKFPNTLFKFVVICLDRNSGKVLWEKTAVEALPHEGHHGDNSHASASPTTDGRQLYVSFGSRGIYCYDLDGNELWKRSLGNVSTRLSFGEACSPVVYGNTVVLNRDNETDSELLAFDAKSGEIRWRAKREEVSAWATPLITESNGRVQVITNASRKVRSYDLGTGEVIWECGGQVANVTPSPLRIGNHVICMSGYKGSVAQALPLDAIGDISGTEKILWTYRENTPYVPSPLLYGEQLYFNKLNNGILTGLDAKTGKPFLLQTRLPGISNIYASPVGAADRLYFVGRDGTTLVLKRSQSLEILATNKIDDLMDASPAVTGQQLFLRGQQHLYCLEGQ